MRTMLFILISGCLCCTAFAQHKYEVGLSMGMQRTTAHYEEHDHSASSFTRTVWLTHPGLAFEMRFSRRSGVGVGMNFRKAKRLAYIAIPTPPNSVEWVEFDVTEKFLSFPLTYKYTSKLFSLSAGITVDHFLSWKQDRRSGYGPLQNYDRFLDQEWSSGLIASISKKISLQKNLILEPVVYYNEILDYKRRYYGGAVQIKWAF